MVDKDKEIMPVVVAAADKRQQQTRLSSSFPATTLQQNQVFVNSCGNCSAAEQSNHYLLDDTLLAGHTSSTQKCMCFFSGPQCGGNMSKKSPSQSNPPLSLRSLGSSVP